MSWARKYTANEPSQPKTFEDYLRIAAYVLTIGTLLAPPIRIAAGWISQIDPHAAGVVQLWIAAGLAIFALVVGKLSGLTNLKIVLVPTVVLAIAGALLFFYG